MKLGIGVNMVFVESMLMRIVVWVQQGEEKENTIVANMERKKFFKLLWAEEEPGSKLDSKSLFD